MLSRMALEDIQSLKKQGVELAPEDIIRLNALGVKCERNHNSSGLYALPRCAFLKRGENIVVLREPTIGQILWYENMMRLYDEEDATTSFFVRAYSLSREDLPDWKNVKVAKEELTKFLKETLKDFTIVQVLNAVNYCIEGSSAIEGEYPDLPDDFTLEKGEELDVPDPIEVGYIRDAQAIGLGLSLEEMKKMTKSELLVVIDRHLQREGKDAGKDAKNKALAEYYTTLNNYRRREAKNDE